MKKPKSHHIHGLSVAAQAAALLIGWRYLPPYLLHNPGVQILVATLILRDLARCIFHE